MIDHAATPSPDRPLATSDDATSPVTRAPRTARLPRLSIGSAPVSHSSSRSLLLAMFGIPLLIMLAIASFAWPAARMAPRDLPLGLVGPGQATDPLAAALSARGFAVHRYDSDAAARAAIEDRDLYGALMLAPDGLTLLTASAASPVVAQLLQQAISGQLAVNPTQPAPPLTVVDVVPADADDPRGAVLGASVMPLVLAGIVLGAVMALIAPPGWRQHGGLIGTALLVGLAVTLVVQSWLGAIGGNWWLNAGVLSLIVLAIAAVVAGAIVLFGLAGAPIASALMLFVGNPWSGVTAAPELLPSWVGITGQLLPPGVGGTLLRSTAFFDGAGFASPLLVLVIWTAIGLTTLWAAAIWRVGDRTDPLPDLAARPVTFR